jgi:hypothetical protein
MSILAILQPTWVLPALLVLGGLVFLAAYLAGKPSPDGNGGGALFLLNIVSLPVGVVVILAAYERWAGLGLVPAVIAVAVGAILAGRSLIEVPWTGVVALVAGVLAGYLLVRDHPVPLSTLEVVAAAGIVFVLVYVILYLIEIPLRIAGLLSLPRPFLVVLGALALFGAALVALV